MIEQHGTGKNKFFTDSRYWDCGCTKNYIHPKSQKSCQKCKCTQVEYPASRVNELHEQLGIKYSKNFLTPTE